MQLLQDILDRSKQLNQAPTQVAKLAYHGPQKRHKIIHQALMIPNLPAPLHYLNFSSMIGQPNIPMLKNPSAIETTALDTATVIASTSQHMVGQLNHYSIAQQCHFEPHRFQFGQREELIGGVPNFQIRRIDTELSFELEIKTTPLLSHLSKIRFGLAEYWSLCCECQGVINYKGQKYEIAQLASFEYARSVHFPYLPLAFLSYQVINLRGGRQILLSQVRDRFNRIIQSRIYLRDLNTMNMQMFDRNVTFSVQRTYPCVMSPNGQRMYLPKMFEWHYQEDQYSIDVVAHSRGDYKFGVGAGYVGSFQYQIRVNKETEYGEGGYIEYIDCRDLCFQEQDDSTTAWQKQAYLASFSYKEEGKGVI